MTLEEYLASPSDDLKTELIYGELVMSPSASDFHQTGEFMLEMLLWLWTKAFDLGWVWHELDMVLDEAKDLVYQPDLLFLAKSHGQRRKRGRIFGPADLAVEIVSPSDRPHILRRKFTDYERYAVAWYWIIDPSERTLEENELVDGVFVQRVTADAMSWFEPGLFPGLQFRLGPLLDGNLKAAIRGKAKKLL